MNGEGVSAYAADGAYLFLFDGATAATTPIEGLTLLDNPNKWTRKGALTIASGKEVNIPFGDSISSGTAVFEIELLPASSTVESVVFKNSKDQTLFSICANVPGGSGGTVYLSNVAKGTEIVPLGTYTKNTWCRLRVELYFDDSQSGAMNFRISASEDDATDGYNEDASQWKLIGSITQEDLQQKGYANGAVTGIDGSADAPFDLAAIAVANSGKNRWLGDISLCSITGDITLAAAPGAQTVGEDFKPGDAAVEVTYSNGEKDTLKLADMMYGVDYTIEGYSKETAVADSVPVTICYGGQRLETTVAVKEPEVTMTGIEVKTEPDKTTYQIGESFDQTGLVVQAVYSNDTKKDLAADAYEITAPDMGTAGYKEVIITYKEDSSFTCKFRVKVQKAAQEMQSIFSYTGEVESLDELGLTGDTTAIGLDTTAVAGNESQKLKFTAAGKVAKSWDNLTEGIVKINVEFNEQSRDAKFRICDKDGKVLINFGQFPSKGNVNLYEGQDTSGTASTQLTKKNYWIRMETEIDLTASNEQGVLQFTTNIFSKKAYSDAEWEFGAAVTQANYQDTFANANGCATEELTEFSVASLVMEGSAAGVCFDNIEVLVPVEVPSQSFYYIDAEDISNLKLEADEGGLAVAADEKGSNETNKLQIKTGTVKKVLENAIDSGVVTFTTEGYQNSAVFGIRMLDSKGNALINYSQQTSGNLNMYKGLESTGTGNTVNLASKRSNKWVKVETEVDLDASNEQGVLQFEMNIYYKNAYTDAEWKLEKTVTQKEAFLNYGVTSGCATEGLTVFDIKELQFESKGTSYVDNIYFDDGNGISGIVTSTKTLQSIEITKPASKLEYVQGSELNTAGLELTGTYLVEYSDGSPSEIKTFKINKYDTEYDFSKINDNSVVTIKVTDNGNEFTTSYTVKVTAKPDGSYVTFSYTDEESAALVGFDGSKIGVVSGDIGVDDNSNASNKIKLDKGSSTLKLTDAVSSGTVHFETKFLTTATSGASLFMRILNSEGEPMVDIGQYGSSNLNLYLDKSTSGDFAARFGGLPVKQWARAEIDIDLDKSKEEGHLVFDAVVWTTDDYGSDEWTKFAEFDQDVYINSTTLPNPNGSASTKATKFDVASVELQNAGGTNYYDDMFFEAINGNARKVLTELKIVSPASKTTYYVGDKANTSGLVLNGTYEYTFSDGTKKQTEVRVMKFKASLDSSVASENALVTISVGGQTVTYPVIVLPNGNLDHIEEYLVSYVDNVLVTLGEDGEIKVNKRQMRLPAGYEKGEVLTWEVVSGNAELTENILTVIPSEDAATEVVLQVTMFTTNEDGNEVVVKKEVRLAVPKDSKKVVDDSMTTEESIRNAVAAMYARGLFDGQANLKDVDAIMAGLERGDLTVTTEEIAVMLVNLFDIDTTCADTKIDREDVEDDAWYSRYVKAAFQLSVETRDSREGKKKYGIGRGVSRANLKYMVNRIVMIDQTTLPSDYADRMFE